MGVFELKRIWLLCWWIYRRYFRRYFSPLYAVLLRPLLFIIMNRFSGIYVDPDLVFNVNDFRKSNNNNSGRVWGREKEREREREVLVPIEKADGLGTLCVIGLTFNCAKVIRLKHAFEQRPKPKQKLNYTGEIEGRAKVREANCRESESDWEQASDFRWTKL